MKANKKSAPIAVAVAPVATVKAATPKKVVVLLKNQVDNLVGYIGGRFPASAYATKLQKQAEELGKIDLPSTGYLLTQGPKGQLIRRVQYNPATGFYSRSEGERTLIGNVKAFGEIEDLKAQIVTTAELMALALKQKEVKRYQHREDDEEVDAAILNKHTDPYVAAVTINAEGKVRVLNIEPPAKYNKVNVQWVLLKDVTDGKLLVKIASMSGNKSLKKAA